MDTIFRERLENILLAFSEVFSQQEIPGDIFESALHEALDALEAELRTGGPVSADWLQDEYETIKDINPAMPAEELFRRLASSLNEKLRGEY